MGNYSDNLLHRSRAHRIAARLKLPKGFNGMRMICALCAGEMLRMPKGAEVTMAEQQAAYDAHAPICGRRHLRAVP